VNLVGDNTNKGCAICRLSHLEIFAFCFVHVNLVGDNTNKGCAICRLSHLEIFAFCFVHVNLVGDNTNKGCAIFFNYFILKSSHFVFLCECFV
jgi:hypothetical protein